MLLFGVCCSLRVGCWTLVIISYSTFVVRSSFFVVRCFAFVCCGVLVVVVFVICYRCMLDVGCCSLFEV